MILFESFWQKYKQRTGSQQKLQQNKMQSAGLPCFEHNDNFCCEVHPDCAQQQKGNDAKPSSCATSCCFTIIDELKNQCVTKQIEVSIVYVSKTCVTIALMY